MRKQTIFGFIATLLLCVVFSVGSFSTADAASRLEKVKETKTLTVGAREGAPPFGFVNEQGQWVGWSMDLSKAIHETIEKKLGMKLELKFKAITPQTRIPLIVNGTLDWVLGTTGKNIRREEVIDFSYLNNAVCVQMLHRKSEDFKSYSDIAGKRVGVTIGSVEQRTLTAMGKSGEISPPPKVIGFEKHSLGFLALEQGKTDVHVTLDVTLNSLRIKSKNPEDWVVHGPELFCMPNGILLAEDDSDWTDTVNGALCYLVKTGEYDRIYDEWFAGDKPKAGFQRPIPGALRHVLDNQCPSGSEKWIKPKG